VIGTTLLGENHLSSALRRADSFRRSPDRVAELPSRRTFVLQPGARSMSRRRALSRSAFAMSLSAAVVAALAAFAPDSRAGEGQPEDLPVNPTRLLVKVRKGATHEQIAAAHARVGATLVRDLPQIGWQIVAVPAGKNLEMQSAYAAEPAIERADLDHARRLAYVPNDPYWPYEWHLLDITADKAWDTVKGDPSVIVAIMDTGLEVTHPDLAANVWTNPGEIPGNGIDDDGNGYVDDVHGYDFAYGDGDPNDNYGHGTACAGLVAAVQDNATGVTGVAPLCQVVGVKAANDSGYFYDSANVPAFLYIADMGFNVVSMSFFADQVTPAEKDAVDYCWSKGVVLVAAAGNDSSVIPYYPGAYEHVISVAATDGGDNRAWFSDYGSWVDVAAPGVSLATTWPGGSYTTGFAGTSGATPHVAGLAALLFSAKPGATNAEVRAALEDTGHPTIDPTLGNYTNYGRIDCKAAVDRIQGTTSGGAAPRFLFAAPVGGDPNFKLIRSLNPTMPRIDIYGVGLEKKNTVRILRDHVPQLLVSQSRQEVSTTLAPITMGRRRGLISHFDLEVNGNVIDGFDWETGPGLVYAPTDVGTSNATVVGGFKEIANVDGSSLTCDDDGNGSITLQLPVRKIRPLQPNSITLEFTRGYTGCTGGTETIQVYDWSTWSYPYGSWLTLSSRPITGTAVETVIAPITVNAPHYLDDSGTMYFVLSVSGASTSGQLNADAFRVRVQ
jgi:subtilisin family serine protease